MRKESSIRRTAAIGGLLALAATIASSVASPPVHAASNRLTDGLVTPDVGTTQTVFTFSVRYAAGQQTSPATSVGAEVAGLTFDLSLAEGTPTLGRWTGISGPLPAGTWPVTFRAVADGPGGDPTLIGPSILVTGGPTPAPTPVPTATPRPAPTSPGTPAPTASARVTPRPGSGSPAPAAASASGAPSAPPGTVEGSAAASPDLSGIGGPSATVTASGTALPRATGGVAGGAPHTGDPGGDVEPDPAPSRFVWGQSAWLVLGGSLATIGALVLAAQWFGHRPLPGWLRRR